MTAFTILDVDQITSPLRIIDPEADPRLAARSAQRARCHGRNRRVIQVRHERFVIMLPPPAPTDLVNLIFQAGTICRLTVRTERHNFELMVNIRLEETGLVLLSETDSHIRIERRERNRLRIDTRIPSRFKHPAGDVGTQHARCIFGRRKRHTED